MGARPHVDHEDAAFGLEDEPADHALHLDALAVLLARGHLREAHRPWRGQRRRAEHRPAGLPDVGGEAAVDHALEVDRLAGPQRDAETPRVDPDARGGVLDEEVRPHGIVVRHHRPQADGMAALDLGGRQVTDLLRAREHGRARRMLVVGAEACPEAQDGRGTAEGRVHWRSPPDCPSRHLVAALRAWWRARRRHAPESPSPPGGSPRCAG